MGFSSTSSHKGGGFEKTETQGGEGEGSVERGKRAIQENSSIKKTSNAHLLREGGDEIRWSSVIWKGK